MRSAPPSWPSVPTTRSPTTCSGQHDVRDITLLRRAGGGGVRPRAAGAGDEGDRRPGHGRALGRPGGAVRPEGCLLQLLVHVVDVALGGVGAAAAGTAPGRAAVAGRRGQGARPPGLRRRRTGRVVRRGAALRYERLSNPRARTFKAIDDRESWVVTCFFVRRPTGQGVAGALLAEVRAVRGPPRRHPRRGLPGRRTRGTGAAATYTGTRSMFERAGFEEAARPGGRPLVRLERPQVRRRR